MKTLSLIILSFFISIPAYSDVVTEGETTVSYEFSIEGLTDLAGYTFVAYPVNISGGSPVNELFILEGDKTYSFVGKYFDPDIYVIETEKLDPEKLTNQVDYGYTGEDESGDKILNYLKENFTMIGTISSVYSVPESVDYSSVKDLYIVSKDENGIKLSFSKREFYQNGKLLKTSDKNDLNEDIDSSFNFKYMMLSTSILALLTIVFIVLKKRKFVK
ncbi:MAG: hypothetical protein OZ913_00255 [Ignavibacteriaceae bacterium]|jgi:hypothetical protein|nr:MAG: hypothetical protein EDM69_04365 [Chlorobiota bacterium]KXK04941.1 MAG: hypothetical protein UZ04_CHB001000829 [Chlorobi bacterium OLB4]MBV6397757.1 hypothetical protein [Ignavibacteria bacterium]MCC6885536.1 hypothetical protein [Ignavibacteriales bacterium]MCE7952887.1 hypothetical protein [Chlorobi bacterium CHB7]MDL1886946.1 hypothetical protein [Ignavibacteria bacterium CHB1]MEB2328717.1 hypothetical protein [Ignavibacteriaceae bacterium]OQY79121.1 MAG: hypothetical protein B6D4